MVRPRSRGLKLLCLTVPIAAILASHAIWMPWLAEFLIKPDAPARADIAVILGGDNYGHRLEKALELVQQGFAPKILLSGPVAGYGYHECDLAMMFVVKKGYPREWFIPFPHSARSTREEAEVVMPELRRLRVHSFLLVTSDFHTRRARAIFRSFARDLDFRVVAAPDEFFRPNDWWHSREAQKTVALEWAKTVGRVFGF